MTELRRRERELMTKDATIREIHHRVKNNLQTVAALLRLQARRLDSPVGQGRPRGGRPPGRLDRDRARHAVDVRGFDTSSSTSIVDRLLAMVADVSSTGTEVRPRREGSFGSLAGDLATPLSMVLTELLQNALEHGVTADSELLAVLAERRGDHLRIEVVDDGRGLPPGFDVVTSANLGLQIVRSLVTGELDGELEIGPRDGGGTPGRPGNPAAVRTHEAPASSTGTAGARVVG